MPSLESQPYCAARPRLGSALGQRSIERARSLPVRHGGSKTLWPSSWRSSVGLRLARSGVYSVKAGLILGSDS